MIYLFGDSFAAEPLGNDIKETEYLYYLRNFVSRIIVK